MSPTLTPERSPESAAPTAADGPPTATPQPPTPPRTPRRRRMTAFFGRHRWVAALVVIVMLAGLAGLGAALQGFGGSDSSAAGSAPAADRTVESPIADGTGFDASPEASKALDEDLGGVAAPVAETQAAGTGVAPDAIGPEEPLLPEQTPQVTGVDRELVRTATLDISAEEPDTASAKARSVVTALGGRVAQEQSSFSGNTSVVLTLAIPPKNFDQAMEELADLGKVTNRTQSTDDVTGEVTDLEGRITTLKASITRLQGFLAEASDAGQIGMLESELLRRETELEGIQGRLRTVEAQVAESTVTLTISEPGERPDPVIEDDDGVGFIDGLTRGWEAFTAVVNAIVVATAALAPFLGIGLLVWLVVRLVRRRGSSAAQPSDG